MRDLEPHCPIWVDKMDDEANRLYGAQPDRLYIILDDVIVYEGKRGPYGYKIEEVYDWLIQHHRS